MRNKWWWKYETAIEYVYLGIGFSFLIALFSEPSIGLTVSCLIWIAIAPVIGYCFLWLRYEVFKQPPLGSHRNLRDSHKD